MWQIIKFLIIGRVCKHQYLFVNVLPYLDNSYVSEGLESVYYTKVCTKCGEHKSGHIYGCIAKHPSDLNIDQKEFE